MRNAQNRNNRSVRFSETSRHPIISQLVPTPSKLSSDGVASEKVVQGGHNCLDQPEVIDEIRRILLVHIGMAR